MYEVESQYALNQRKYRIRKQLSNQTFSVIFDLKTIKDSPAKESVIIISFLLYQKRNTLIIKIDYLSYCYFMLLFRIRKHRNFATNQ